MHALSSFALNEEKICAFGNKKLCFWQNKKAKDVVFLSWRRDSRHLFVSESCYCQIQTTSLIMFYKEYFLCLSWEPIHENKILLAN